MNEPLLHKNIIIGGITGSGKTSLAKYILENAIKTRRDVHLMTQDSEIMPSEYTEYDDKAICYLFPGSQEREYIDTFYKLSQQNFRENSFILIDELHPSLIDEDIFADFAILLKDINSQIIVVTQSLEMEIDLLSSFAYIAIRKDFKNLSHDAQVKAISTFDLGISINNSTWNFHKIKDVIEPLSLRTRIETISANAPRW